jgi:hypothetical protein
MSSTNGSCEGANTATRSTSIDSVCAAESGGGIDAIETFLPKNGNPNRTLTNKGRMKRFFTKYFLQGKFTKIILIITFSLF